MRQSLKQVKLTKTEADKTHGKILSKEFLKDTPTSQRTNEKTKPKLLRGQNQSHRRNKNCLCT
jgi:hypothetical protein